MGRSSSTEDPPGDARPTRAHFEVAKKEEDEENRRKNGKLKQQGKKQKTQKDVLALGVAQGAVCWPAG